MKKLSTLIMAICCALSLTLGMAALVKPVKAATLASDPSFNFIAGGKGDIATINDDGTVDITATPTPGFGFRANASLLGEVNLYDVKHFTTKITLVDVPVNVSTIFGLQTVPTGTVGGGNGNAINIMFRRDGENVVAVSVYDAAASEPAYWAPGQLALPEDKSITITYNYDASPRITITLKDTYALNDSLIKQAAFDDHYAASGYKGYYSISSYYFVAPATTTAQYRIESINGKTPLENYKSIVQTKIDAFNAAVNALTDDSADEEIIAAKEADVFESGVYATLLGICDDEANTLANGVASARAAYAGKYEKVLYGEVDAQIDAFSAALNGLDVNDETAVAAAIAKYNAIDRETLNGLSETYKTTLLAKLEGVVKGDSFKAVVKHKTDKYIAEYEEMVKEGDAAALSTYKKVNAIVENWTTYKEENFVTLSLSADETKAYDDRIKAIGEKMSKSFYSSFWTEGNTWEARKTDLGLYASGAGKYYETLGFNQKLEIGKTTTVEFNIISALRKLGANHLHLGFYPVVGTGTKGTSDGVRVDFWFSAAGTIEIKPVNGRTEESDVFEGAYLSVPDTGDIDLDADEIDYTAGKYVVSLLVEDGTLVLNVNGMEMDLIVSPELYKDGAYLTVSAMSVEGADNNEILITKVGNTSYVKGEDPKPVDPDSSSSTDNNSSKENNGDNCANCSGSIESNVANIALLALAFVLTIVIRKKANG